MSFDINVLVVIPADGLSLFFIECLGLGSNELFESLLGLSRTRLVGLRVHHTKHLVVLSVDVKLQWVLVVREQRVVTICQVGEGTTLFEREKIYENTRPKYLRCRRSSQLAIGSAWV